MNRVTFLSFFLLSFLILIDFEMLLDAGDECGRHGTALVCWPIGSQ